MGYKRREFLKSFSAILGISGVTGSASLEQNPGQKNETNELKNFRNDIQPEKDRVEDIADRTFIIKYRGGKPNLHIFNGPDFKPKEDSEIHGKDRWYSATEYIENNFVGDCEDYASFMTSIFASKGYKAHTVVGSDPLEEEEIDDGENGHAWTEVNIEGEYYITDINNTGELIERDSFDEELYEWEERFLIDQEEVEEYYKDW